MAARSKPKLTLNLTAGPLLYVLNSAAAQTLKELGAARFSLSLEDDKENIAAILRRDLGIPGIATVYSPVALISSRIPMRIREQKPILESDSGEILRLDFSTGLTVAYGGQNFSLLGHLNELQAMGCANLMADIAEFGAFSKQGKLVRTALSDDQVLPETTLMNFERGLE